MKKQRNKSKMGIIIFSGVCVLVAITTSIGLWIGFTNGAKSNVQNVSVFDHIIPYVTGVEDAASIKIMVDEYAIEEDTQMARIEKEELVAFLKSLEYTIEGQKLEILEFNFDNNTLEEETTSKLFAVENGDYLVLEVMVPITKNRFEILASSFEFEVSGLGRLITSIEAVTPQMLDQLEASAQEYVALGFSFEKNYTDIESAIKSGEANRVGIYYRLDAYKDVDFNFYRNPYPFALTIAFAYEYDGYIYLLTKTGLTIPSYSFGEDSLTFGETIYHDDFAFTAEENSFDNITVSMKGRGYELLQTV